jgi:hypothetical protein
MAPLVERIALGGLGADPGLIVVSVAADVDAGPRSRTRRLTAARGARSR